MLAPSLAAKGVCHFQTKQNKTDKRVAGEEEGRVGGSFVYSPPPPKKKTVDITKEDFQTFVALTAELRDR